MFSLQFKFILHFIRALFVYYWFCYMTFPSSYATTISHFVTSSLQTVSRWETWFWALSHGTCVYLIRSHLILRYFIYHVLFIYFIRTTWSCITHFIIRIILLLHILAIEGKCVKFKTRKIFGEKFKINYIWKSS